RSAGRSYPPGALSLGRLSVAVAGLAILGLLRGERLPSRDALREVGIPLLVCGLLWFGAYNVALNSGERRVDAGTAAMLVNVGPILIAVLAGLLLREGFPSTLFGGLAVAFAGVVVIAVASSTHSATTYLVPPISVLLGWAWLNETPAGLAYLGGALCLAGVAVSRRPGVRHRKPVSDTGGL